MRRRVVMYDPFALWLMFSRCECQKCGCEFDKPFERFEYAYEEIEWSCPDCETKTKCTILGCIHIHMRSPQELKWAKTYKRFETEAERQEHLPEWDE